MCGWDRAAIFQTEIRGSTVGLLGYGGIARETARLCKATRINGDVLTRSAIGPRRHNYCLPSSGDPQGVLPDRVYGPQQRYEFLRGLDFLILCAR